MLSPAFLTLFHCNCDERSLGFRAARTAGFLVDTTHCWTVANGAHGAETEREAHVAWQNYVGSWQSRGFLTNCYLLTPLSLLRYPVSRLLLLPTSLPCPLLEESLQSEQAS